MPAEVEERSEAEVPPEAEEQPQPDPQPEIVEAEVVEPSGSTALVERPSREVLMPLDPDQVVAGMEAYQALLPKLLDASDYQEAEQGKRFVKKSGWRKISRAFNLSVTIVSAHVGRDADGRPIRAEVIARALAPNGSSQDGDGYCSIEEKRFEAVRESPESSRAKNMKLENDLRATATTRAKNRAISDLVGMGEVSAEEVDGGGGGHGPAFGPEADGDVKKSASVALEYLVGPEAEGLWGQIKGVAGGYMPQLVASSIVAIARTKRELDDAVDDASTESHRPEAEPEGPAAEDGGR